MDPAEVIGSGGLLLLRLTTISTALAAIYLTLKLLWPRKPTGIRFRLVGAHRHAIEHGGAPSHISEPLPDHGGTSR